MKITIVVEKLTKSLPKAHVSKEKDTKDGGSDVVTLHRLQRSLGNLNFKYLSFIYDNDPVYQADILCFTNIILQS